MNIYSDLSENAEIEDYPEPQPPERIPDCPTGYAPGSKEKVEVMASRYERGESIWHPHDAKTCRDLPESVQGKTYVQAMPGLNLRTRDDGTSDYFVSTWVFGIRLVKRFPITEYEQAVKYLQDAQNGAVEGMREIVEELLS